MIDTRKLTANSMRSIFLTVFILTIAFISVGQIRQKLSPMENPRITIKKKQRLLQIFDGEKLVESYKIVLGFASEGDKEIEGDGKTPTGTFYVFTKNPESRFHLSLGLSYPNAVAATRGLRENLISQTEHDQIMEAIAKKEMPPQKTALGGEIYIHGGGIKNDWTQGCVALDNEKMTEIFNLIPVGAEVVISE